jgi:superfamily II DNA or RNA helicase
MSEVVLFEDQKEVLDKVRSAFIEGHRSVMLYAPTGAGKCLGRDTPVMMADGTIKPVQDIIAGEFLMGDDGDPRCVMSTATGREMLYRVTPRKGDSYVVNASHLLSLRVTPGSNGILLADGMHIKRGEDVVSVRADVFARSNRTAKHCLKGWRSDAIQAFMREDDGEDRLMPSYILGAWLGDGTLGHASITKPRSRMVDEWVAYGRSIGYGVSIDECDGRCPTWLLTNGSDGYAFNIAQSSLGVIGVLQRKHIPDAYKYGPLSDRLQLLAGLIDSDGSESNGGCDWISKSEELARDFAFVCRSVGLACYLTYEKKGIKSTGFVGWYWRASVSGDLSIIPTRDKIFPERRQIKRHLVHGITVEPMGEGDYFGFEIDGNRLFLLGDFTVTHNTEMAISMLKATSDKYKRGAMMLDRIVLCNQTSARLQKYNIDHGVMQSGHWRNRPYERIQVCSAQTLEKRGSFPGLDLLIVDECFPGETLIDTIDGARRIDTLNDGGLIYNAIGTGTVRSIFSKTVFQTLLVRMSNGDSFECTEDHPVFTDLGWQPAGAMARGTKLFRGENLRSLWRGDSTACHKLENGGSDTGSGNIIQCAEMLREILRQEIEQPDAQAGIAYENEGYASPNWAQAIGARRQWEGHDGDRDAYVEQVAGGVGSRPHFQDVEKCGSGVSASLQIGSCVSYPKALSGVGWRESSLDCSASAGREEGCAAKRVWVESVQTQEHPSGRTVFNLRVSGHPSYFANGYLVHNCHTQRQQTTEFIRSNESIKVIGLSASPFADGLGKTYTKVVSATTTAKLVDQKRLVPLRVFIAKEIDMAGAKKVAGEWSQGEAAERGMKITGDVVAEWVKKTTEIFGGPRKTIVFCSNVAHGADLANKFSDAGYNFVAISYKDSDEFKVDAVADFSKPDTAIHGLIACDILTKGFDVPDVMIGVSARPFTKSFMSHVQQMGRVMRSYPEKEFAIWLDHSGNYLRFQEDWDELYHEGVHELSDGKEKAKKEKSDKEKEAAKCPRCHALWVGKSDNCVACGYARPFTSLIEAVPGEMEELKGAPTKDVKQSWYSQLRTLAENRGYSNGWVAHKYRTRFGVWPKGLQEVALPVSIEVARWETSQRIAWAKGKKSV